MEEWDPPQRGEHWMEWLVSMIPDQGTWGTSDVRYRLDKTSKTAYVLKRNKARPADITEKNCQRIAEAFNAIGWQVMDRSRQSREKETEGKTFGVPLSL